LKSLKFEQIDARRSGIKPNHGETCQWLLKHSDYLDWLDPEKAAEHHGFLWIKGKPGAGKSTIMNFAYRQAMKAKAGTVISFFFNGRGDFLERTTAGMYRSLLFQLLNALPRLTEVFNGSEHKNILDELHETIMNQSTHPEWQVGVLQGLLRSAIAMIDQQPLTIFVDALDECDMEQVEEMVEFFEDSGKFAVSSGSRLQICFSSRHYPHIDIQHGRKLSLELQEGHEKDIASYIQSKLRVGKSKAAEEIKTKMRNKAGGIFMWVVLVTGILNTEYKGGRIFDVRKRLDAIPTKLSDLFREILWRDQKNLQDLQLCIQWILFAKRPLKLEEYYFAAVSGLSPDELCEWDPEDITREDMSRFVISSSKGLAETTKSRSPTVQFIHESVREFFLKDGLRELWPDLTADFQSFSHLQLQQCCYTYLKLDIDAYGLFGTPLPKASSDRAKDMRSSVSDKFPFLQYATHHVLFHADAAANAFPQDKFLQTFELGLWIHLDNLFQIYDIRRHTPFASLLYILAENNLANLIRTALLFDSRIDIRGERHDCPLFAALANGHRDAVKALLQNEASCSEDDISAPLEYGNAFTYHKSQTPLSWAAQNGHEPVVRQLLTREGVDVNTKDKKNYTPLLWAAYNGHVAVVERILTRDEVDVNAKDSHGLTPLSLAAANGHESVVEHLLAKDGIDVDSKDKYGRTTLILAARHRHLNIANLLLDTGKADVNAKDVDGQTPLLWAAMEGHETVVKLLLDTCKADVNAKDNSGRGPLSWAARQDHEAIVKQLLARDDVNVAIKDRHGQTPLSLAAAKGHRSIVEQLLARDASDVNIKHSNYSRTPLSLAAVNGHESVVEHLLTRDNVDVDTSDCYGLTPLSLAAANGHKSVIEQLLARDGVDVNTKDSRYGRTPLSLAAENGNESVVRQLLTKDGVDVDTKDSYDRTPLSWAAENGHQFVAKQLLARDEVNVDTKDRYGQTPLSWAAEHGHEKVVKLLIDNGKADINSTDNSGRTPLLWAAMKGHETVVKLLLDTGRADINAKDHDGQTPLRWAVKNRHKSVRRLLQSMK
jgi:ankyrin repeat protein